MMHSRYHILYIVWGRKKFVDGQASSNLLENFRSLPTSLKLCSCALTTLYTCEMPKFPHDKTFESAMVDKFEITSCKYLGIIFIKIVGYTPLGNGWIAILVSSGEFEPCINSSGKAALFQRPSPRWKVNQKNSLKKILDRDLPFLKLSENVLL